MTKRKEFFTCKSCGKTFPRPDKKRLFCSLECRFWRDVKKTDYCWNWTGSKHSFGYGEFRSGNTLYRAHRFSYELHFGEIVDGLGINHKCNNTSCVNPDHLYAGTQHDNMSDMSISGRVGTAKLNAKLIPEIREKLLSGTPKRELGRQYGVSPTVIYNIATGKTWCHA